MLESLTEQWETMWQNSTPLRVPPSWGLAVQMNREYPVVAKIALVVFLSMMFWMVSFLTGPKRLEKTLGLPVVSGSRTLKKDFVAIIEDGRQMVRKPHHFHLSSGRCHVLVLIFILKYPDQPFIINSSGRQFVCYPPSNFNEIKSLPETEASAQSYFYDATFGDYTHVGAETPALWKTIVTDLARAGPPLVSTKQEDARTAFDRYVGDCPEGKAFNVFDTMMKIVSLTNGASFVGREMAGGKWHDLVAQLPMTVFVPIMLLPWIPRLLQPLAMPLLFLPNRKIQRDMRRLLEPNIKKDSDEWETAKKKKEALRVQEGERLPYHKWLMSRYNPGEATPRQLATDQILTAFESTVSSAIFLHNVLFDIAARPEVQDELRREVVANTVDGRLPATNLKELRMMDSVMRETFRTRPSALCMYIPSPLTHNSNTPI